MPLYPTYNVIFIDPKRLEIAVRQYKDACVQCCLIQKHPVEIYVHLQA